MRAVRILPWTGLGATVLDRDDGDDCTTLDTLSATLALGTVKQRDAVLAMIATTGANLSDVVRLVARNLRRKASKRGIYLQPWWRLRLAVRRTGWVPPPPTRGGATRGGKGR
jgi:hypothetical protein